jgi:hypothetical protein
MKILFILCLLLTTIGVNAQTYQIRKDTIVASGKAYAIVTKRKNANEYFVRNLLGRELIAIYPARSGKASGYVVSFMHEHKDAFLQTSVVLPKDFITMLLKYDLIGNGMEIKAASAENFVKDHPVPKDFVDTRALNEYGYNLLYLK